jgi:hypothetical protein
MVSWFPGLFLLFLAGKKLIANSGPSQLSSIKNGINGITFN